MIKGDSVIGATYAPRTVSTAPVQYRQVRYPDGSVRLQGGYQWFHEWKTGVDWKDIPVIDVDEEGTEIDRD